MLRRSRIDYPGALHRVLNMSTTDHLSLCSLRCYAWNAVGNHVLFNFRGVIVLVSSLAWPI